MVPRFRQNVEAIYGCVACKSWIASRRSSWSSRSRSPKFRLRVVEPVVLVRAGVDRLQIRLKLRQPGGRLHQVVDQQPALGIPQQRLVQGGPERRRVVGEQLGRGDPVHPAPNMSQIVEERPVDLSRFAMTAKPARLAVRGEPFDDRQRARRRAG